MTSRAYVLRFYDGDREPCCVVWAASADAAHACYGEIPGAMRAITSVERAPMFDGADPAVPIRFYGSVGRAA